MGHKFPKTVQELSLPPYHLRSWTRETGWRSLGQFETFAEAEIESRGLWKFEIVNADGMAVMKGRYEPAGGVR